MSRFCGFDVHGNRQSRRIIRDHINGPRRHVPTFRDTMEVDERQSLFHHIPQTAVLIVGGISATVSVSKQTVVAEQVIVGT